MANPKRIILGLDISTHCTGVAKMSYDEATDSFELMDSVKLKFKVPNKLKGDPKAFYIKVLQFKQFVDTWNLSDVTDIVIEQALPNANNLYTVNELLEFNGILSWMLYERTSIIPMKISSYDARRFAFPDLCSVRRLNKKGEAYGVSAIRSALKHNEAPLFGDFTWDCEKKIILWNKINELFPDIEWEYNDKGELRKENFDLSDAMVCALGLINYEKYKETKLSIKSFKETDVKARSGEGKKKFDYMIDFCGRTIKKSLTVSEKPKG